MSILNRLLSYLHDDIDVRICQTIYQLKCSLYPNLRLDKRLSKQSWGWWSEMPSRSLWRHRNAICTLVCYAMFYSGYITVLDGFLCISYHMLSGCIMGSEVTAWMNSRNTPRWHHTRGFILLPISFGLWRNYGNGTYWALMLSLICARINVWANNREAGDLR